MDKIEINNSILHYKIVNHIINKGFAPEIKELALEFQLCVEEVVTALKRLEADHGVVLHPNGKIWVIHPFSLAPTNFLVHYDDKEWWSNCAWCALGVAGLLKKDVTITTTSGANSRQIDIHIQNDKVMEDNLLVHFPIPMNQAWDNVIYTCSTMLIFETETDINLWCDRHQIPKGDVQPITKIWEFAKVWYGNHLNPNWKKWTTQQAQEIFDKFGLTGHIWKIGDSNTRF